MRFWFWSSWWFVTTSKTFWNNFSWLLTAKIILRLFCFPVFFPTTWLREDNWHLQKSLPLLDQDLATHMSNETCFLLAIMPLLSALALCSLPGDIWCQVGGLLGYSLLWSSLLFDWVVVIVIKKRRIRGTERVKHINKSHILQSVRIGTWYYGLFLTI